MACAIYETRPERCRSYPSPVDRRPKGCSFTFEGFVRSGACEPLSCGPAICCSDLRVDGDPLGSSAPSPVGMPCRHLILET